MENNATYSGITPEVYNSLKDKLAGLGIELKGNMGKVSEKGVSAEYNFDETNQTLSINNVKVGFPASMMYSPEKIIGQISEAVTSAGGKEQTA